MVVGVSLFLVLVIVFSPVFSYQYGISFFGISTDKENYSSGENISIITTLINSENYVHTNLTLVFKLVRDVDGSVVSSKSVSLDLDKKEVKKITESLEISQKILSGSYSVFIGAYSASDSLTAVIHEEVNIKTKVEEGVILDKKGVYLEIPIEREITEGITHTITTHSYGESGETIPQNNSFFIRFNLKNIGEMPLNTEAKIKIVPTYEKNKITKLIKKSLGLIEVNKTKSYSIETKLEKPGTYKAILEIYADNEKILEREVRIVIGGEGGSILALRNLKDIYKRGEKVKVDVSLVGPADKSKVKNCYLKLKIIKEKAIKVVNKKITELSSTPTTTSFEFKAPENLDYYDLLVTLGKGDKIFDTARASYRDLEPEFVFTEDGRIRNIKVKGCFDDGNCTEDELEIGDCLDCKGVAPQEKPKITLQKDWIYMVLLLVFLVLLILSTIYIKKRR